MVDDIYCKLMQFSITDLHSNAYFGIVLNGLFFELEQKEVYLFYIVDNEIRDDRFKILEQMFRVAHFAVIHPYAVDKFEHTQEYTKLPAKPYEKIKQEIDDAIANKQHKKHILYVEKDDSANYIKEVLEYALENQKNKYACMFRNKKLDEPAHYLTTWKNMPEEKDNKIYVWCNRGSTGIWVAENNGRLINSQYGDFNLPSDLIARFRRWEQLFNDSKPELTDEQNGFDRKTFNGYGFELAMDTKRFLGDKYRIFYRYSTDSDSDIEIVPK
jgi:hypothetical protein